MYRSRLVPSAVMSLVICVLVLAAPTPSAAQQETSIEWTERSRIEASGVLGALLGRLPRASGESSHGLFIQGNRVRQDSDGSSTIFDLEAKRWISLDHDQGTYTDFSLDDLRESMSALAEVQEELRVEIEAMREEVALEFDEEWEELRAEMERAMSEAEASFDVQIRTERAGERRSFGPATAERHFITVEIQASEGFSSMEGVEEDMGEGMLVLLIDLWKSDDFPDPDQVFEEFARQMAEDPEMLRLAEETAATVAPLAEAFGPDALAVWDPRIAAAFRRAGEAMEALDGTTLSSATHVAIVPEGVNFDRDALLAWEPETMGDQLRASAGEQAGAAARGAARGALRGITRGVMGRGGDREEEAEEEEATVRPLFRYITERTDIRTGSPSAELFSVPENYQAKPLPDFGELMRGRPDGG